MSLKFPNARLFVHELLTAERLSGPQAIALGSCQFGLIPSDAMADVLEEKSGHQCQCMATAENVVAKHFEKYQETPATMVDPKDVWSAIEKHFNIHSQLLQGQTSCEGEHAAPSSQCQKHAPVLVDLMLQQIMRYP